MSDRQTDGRTDRQTDICDFRVAFATENLTYDNMEKFPVPHIIFNNEPEINNYFFGSVQILGQ